MHNDDVFDLSKEMKDKGFTSPFEQLIKQNPHWIFLYNWPIVNLSDTARRVKTIELMIWVNVMRFPPIGKN